MMLTDYLAIIAATAIWLYRRTRLEVTDRELRTEMRCELVLRNYSARQTQNYRGNLSISDISDARQSNTVESASQGFKGQSEPMAGSGEV